MPERHLYRTSVDFIAERLSKLLVEFEHVYRRSPDLGQPGHFDHPRFGFQLAENEVLGPSINPRMKEPGDLAGLGIDTRQVWTLL